VRGPSTARPAYARSRAPWSRCRCCPRPPLRPAWSRSGGSSSAPTATGSCPRPCRRTTPSAAGARWLPTAANWNRRPHEPRRVAMTKEKLIEQAYTVVTGERQQAYGSPKDNLTVTAAIWSAQLSRILTRPITPGEVAQLMVGLKLARLVQSPDHVDSWRDVIGWGAVGGEVSIPEGKE